ncbi:phosphoadenosine phosphosulfate reductase family protein [Magnetospirillum fulvum]|uniref:Phosphoadenosine phosphosulfate reductase n=1 Tax=Magnetospirillum fulvum MGU-K5 TaxID=1316936 RepID=S9SA67_MAGFU|nr:phosphoadenosine phosphosulfate reductase family protein [Magnetospirillum fulvum]EPY00963.1 phosphoadenosine phosphosulfate reductase [Magnetospirillum fulvum MGU-K5]
MKPVTHVLSYSGGKDSTALYLLGIEIAERWASRRGQTIRVVFADTGNEHPETLDYVRDLPRRSGGPAIEWVRADFTADFARKRHYVAEHWPADGVPDSIVSQALEVLAEPTGIPFLDLCLLKGRFPSRRAQFCTSELKVIPITEQIILPLLESGLAVFSWQGIRAEESPERATKPRIQSVGGGLWIWRPLHAWTIDRVFAIHRRHGIEPNPLYRQGMHRVGCMPCINCRKDELREIARRFPDHIDKIAAWEAIASQASKRGATTFFHKENASGDRSAEEIFAGANVRQAVAWAMTSRGGKQLDMLRMHEPLPVCSSAYGLCE